MGEPDGNAIRILVPIVCVVALRLSLSLRQLFSATSYMTMTRSSGKERGETLPLNTRPFTDGSTDRRVSFVRVVKTPSI